MKRIMIGMIFCGILLSGCGTISGILGSQTQYYFEAFIVSQTNFNSIPVPENENITLDSVRTYKNNLKKFSIEEKEPTNEATIEDIRNFFKNEAGFSSSDIDPIISRIRNNDFHLNWYESTDNKNMVVYYTEKQ